MRFLFSFTGGNGHFLPTLPMARAAARRGHAIAYACQEAMLETVEAAGFTAFATGGPTLLDPSTRRPLVAVDRMAEERVIRTAFAGRTAQARTPRLVEVASHWRPDVVVRDEIDFGAAVAAEAMGIPHASVIVIAAGGLVRPDVVAAPLSQLRADYGLGPDPTLLMLHRYLTLVPVPASYRDPRDPLPATAHHLQPAVLDDGAGAAGHGAGPEPPEARGGRPTVYFTLGTVFHQESGDLFTRVLAGLRRLPFDVVVTVGREIDPAELGDQPSHVRVERFVPPADLLPRCHVVVSHAGSGTVIGALAFGVPSVLLPLGADQPLNADRCGQLGVGVVLDPLHCRPDEVAAAVTTVWTDPAYRAAAIRIRDEIRALPGSDLAARLIEQLGSDKRPIVDAPPT
jgi:UDP:flavonoid glycosyltransferase YjiC (YdhE family)